MNTERLTTASGDRAVSPVIGVILMVAITVILAAVIGAFVLKIGEQQETAPSTSFDVEQTMMYYCDKNNNDANLTTLEVTHAGGENVDLTNLVTKVAGDTGVWGKNPDADTGCGGAWGDAALPAPNYLETLGTNDKISLSSGETMHMYMHGGPTREELGNLNFGTRADNNGAQVTYIEVLYHTGNQEGFKKTSPGGAYTMNVKTNGGATYPNGGYFHSPPIEKIDQGEDARVVWEASSGGKSQTLFVYTVQ